MTMSSLHARRLVATSFLFAALGMLACEGDPATSPDGMQIRAAKPPKDGGGEIKIIVDTADPPEGEQGAVGLEIRVLGSGFEKGAKVLFHLNFKNDPDPDPGMTVQSTKFVNDTELIATTDIALDAEASSRDISVSFRGRRGIGTETFDVKLTGKPQGTTVSTAFDNPDPDCDPTKSECFVAGIYSDNFDLYGPDDGSSADYSLDPQCGEPPAERREMFLVLPADENGDLKLPDGTVILTQAEVDVITCRPEDWLFLKLHDLATITEDCGEDGERACPFATVPAMKKRGKKYQPDGMFGPTAEYFVFVRDDYYNFVWQDASVDVTKAGGEVLSWHVTASKANLYVGLDLADPWDTTAMGLSLALDVTIVPDYGS